MPEPSRPEPDGLWRPTPWNAPKIETGSIYTKLGFINLTRLNLPACRPDPWRGPMNKIVRSPTNIVNPASRRRLIPLSGISLSRRAALSFRSLKVVAASTDACPVLAAVKLLPDSTIGRILGRQSNGGRDPPLSVGIQREPLIGWERLMKRALDLV